jgi:DNA-binding transcriptional LysR family regulator
LGPLESLEEVEKNFQCCAQKDLPSLTVGMCYETFQETLEKHLPNLSFNLILEFGEYKGLLEKLGQGVIDLVVTPRRLERKGILFEPISIENIVLLAGKDTEVSGFEKSLQKKDHKGLLSWLKAQKWYGITGDNEHLRRFWQHNFNSLPDFRPNFIVPNIHSIVRSLAAGPGLGVAPDFLCKSVLAEKQVKILWHGFNPISNYLYIAKSKKPFYPAQMEEIVKILQKELPPLPGNTEIEAALYA